MVPSGISLAPQIRPPCSVPSSFMKSKPAASVRSGLEYCLWRFQAPGKSARLDSVKWILVGGFAILFALGGAFLWRRPQVAMPEPAAAGVYVAPGLPAAASMPPVAATANAATAGVRDASSEIMAAVAQQARLSLDELKDQMFRLELRRQAGTISESDYAQQRDRFEATLRELVRG